MRPSALPFLLLTPIVLAAPVAAQDDAHVGEILTHATEHFRQGQWGEAVEAYRHVLQHQPDDGLANFNLGFSLIQTGDVVAAKAAFLKCLELGVFVEPSTYNVACCNALVGDVEGGLEWLARAIAGGFNDFELARTDGDLDAIRGDARFEAILAGKPYAAPGSGSGVKLRGGGTVEDYLRKGNAARDSGDPRGAAVAYTKAVELDPKNGMAHFQRGYVSLQAKDYGTAEASFLTSRALGFAVPASTYNLACTNALQGNLDAGMKWLDVAVREGFDDVELARTDGDLDALRGDPRFASIVSRIGKSGASAPAEASAGSPLTAKHREFDFWVGDWSVVDAAGKKLGENRIELLHNGAALKETWTSAGGHQGTSLTFYEASKDRWHQTWIDGSGNALFTDGGLKNGAMVLGNANGANRNRVTWTPMGDGRVRQLWESSKDGGKTWSVAFDGYYMRKTKPATAQEY